MEHANDGQLWGEGWMLHVTQAICGDVSHAIEPRLGSVHSYWGSKSPRPALDLLRGAEELQSFR